MPCSGCSALHGVNPNFLKKCEYEGALKESRFKADFKYTKNERSKPKEELEISLGLTHYLTNWYSQMLQKL